MFDNDNTEEAPFIADEPKSKKKKSTAKESPVSIELASKTFIDSAKKSISQILAEQFDIDLNEGEIKSLVSEWNQKIKDGEYSISDIKDSETYNKVVRARALFRTTRTSIEKKRKELKSVPNEMGRAIDSFAKGLTELVEPIEETLSREIERVDAEKDRIRLEKEKQEQAFFDARVKSLMQVGCSFDGMEYSIGEFSTFSYDIKIANEDEFETMVAKAIAEANKLAEAKAEQLRLQNEEDERRSRELLELEEGKKRQLEEAEKLRKEKEEFEQKQKDELQKFFAERQELERQKQELINSKRDARAQQLTNIGYELHGSHWLFNNKYGQCHYIEVNTFVLGDTEWKDVVETAIKTKQELISAEKERDEFDAAERKQQQEKAILRQRTKDRIAQLLAEGFVKDGDCYFAEPKQIVSPDFLEDGEPAEWNAWFFKAKSAIDFKKKQDEEKTQHELLSDTEKINLWATGVTIAVDSLYNCELSNTAIAIQFEITKNKLTMAIQEFNDTVTHLLKQNPKSNKK